MSDATFHPIVERWFHHHFQQPTAVQAQAWRAIQQDEATLLAAPTGSGKTLAAFLASIDRLLRAGLQQTLENQIQVLYISPLKALSNDIEKNLQHPLLGIREYLQASDLPDVDIQTAVRTGDTPASARERIKRHPPHILVTTPESLYLMLTAASGRTLLQSVNTVIVDEIHALAGNKRGAHLSLSLERLNTLCNTPPQRIGISATQKPIEQMARFLMGSPSLPCTIIDTGHVRERDLAIETTSSPLEAVMANEVWSEIYDRLAALCQDHRTTLIFVNTRRLAERATKHLSERLGDEAVTSHHGSLSREHRLDAEQRLKSGQLKALVATASLELGIDIGDVDLVCQLGSPGSIAAFLQRVGRSGHAVDATPKGRLFPLSRDDLVESVAILRAIENGDLDTITIPHQPLDVLAQQIVAEAAGSEEITENALYQLITQAWPYRNLSKDDYLALLKMLAEGFTTRRGRRSAYLHWDRVNQIIRPRRNARLTALTNGGAIPDLFDCDVVLMPEGFTVGSVNEDFAFESLPGSIFQLGNMAYRILKVETGKMYVEDAKGQPPNIPFWLGEAPGRSDELSLGVSTLRQQLDKQLDEGIEKTVDWLHRQWQLAPDVAQQLTDYLATAKAALTVLPNHQHIVFERFFDETGDMHLVIHSAYGSRINRAWGLALRKRFCRKFNFELQAAALDDSIVLSLGATHSFPLDEVQRFLQSSSVRDVLIQALLDAPMFETHWRWNATIALAVIRNRNGKRVPPQFQRNDAEDLIALVFPDQIACFENIQGKREVPDHPLVHQAIHDCITDVMDIVGLEHLLSQIEAGNVTIVCRDLSSPSLLAQEIITAKPFAFLDDAPAEERRTLAIHSQRFMSPQDAEQMGQLDAKAIAQVCDEAWPDARDSEELHDALVMLGFIAVADSPEAPHQSQEMLHNSRWQPWLSELAKQKRACALTTSQGTLWFAAERLHEALALFPQSTRTPNIAPIEAIPDADDARVSLLRSRLEATGPVTLSALITPLQQTKSDGLQALLTLEQEGFAVQGDFLATQTIQWCERRLLARIHRYTLQHLRKEIQPVPPAQFMQFLFHWQGLQDKPEGEAALIAALEQLAGLPLPAAAWEREVLPARITRYHPSLLDNVCNSGYITWLRAIPGKNSRRSNGPLATTNMVLLPRSDLLIWLSNWHDDNSHDTHQLSSVAEKLYQQLQQQGACFFMDFIQQGGVLRTQVEDGLSELAAQGLITSDSFAGLRALITPQSQRPRFQQSRARGALRGIAPPSHAARIDHAGRWACIRRDPALFNDIAPSEQLEQIAWILLNRYGVVCRKLLQRESHLPSWRELATVLRRFEARGEIRGGRFIAGVSGEQFALTDAIPLLRDQRQQTSLQIISAADPLNLTGIITTGERVPAVTGTRILYRDGVPKAAITQQGALQWFGEISPQEQQQITQQLKPSALSSRRKRPPHPPSPLFQF